MESNRELIPRNQLGVKCQKCGGYSEGVDCTKEEISLQDCGRNYAHCISAFVCGLCNTRFLCNLKAPEME